MASPPWGTRSPDVTQCRLSCARDAQARPPRVSACSRPGLFAGPGRDRHRRRLRHRSRHRRASWSGSARRSRSAAAPPEKLDAAAQPQLGADACSRRRATSASPTQVEAFVKHVIERVGPHRHPRQQRRRSVPVARAAHLAERLPRGREEQPRRHVPHVPRGREPVDDPEQGRSHHQRDREHLPRLSRAWRTPAPRARASRT